MVNTVAGAGAGTAALVLLIVVIASLIVLCLCCRSGCLKITKPKPPQQDISARAVLAEMEGTLEYSKKALELLASLQITDGKDVEDLKKVIENYESNIAEAKRDAGLEEADALVSPSDSKNYNILVDARLSALRVRMFIIPKAVAFAAAALRDECRSLVEDRKSHSTERLIVEKYRSEDIVPQLAGLLAFIINVREKNYPVAVGDVARMFEKYEKLSSKYEDFKSFCEEHAKEVHSLPIYESHPRLSEGSEKDKDSRPTSSLPGDYHMDTTGIQHPQEDKPEELDGGGAPKAKDAETTPPPAADNPSPSESLKGNRSTTPLEKGKEGGKGA